MNKKEREEKYKALSLLYEIEKIGIKEIPGLREFLFEQLAELNELYRELTDE